MRVRTVLLDLDGVVRHFDPEHVKAVEQQHGLAAGSLRKAAFEPQLLEGVITGRISRDEWIHEIGRRVNQIEAAAQWMSDRGTVDEAMLTEVDALRASGIVVAILTNGTDTIAEEATALGLDVRFDVIFNSAEIGFAKPDPRVFSRVCSELGVDPTLVFFTDDTESKLGGARELGMMACRFEGVEKFKQHLVGAGLKG